MIIRDYLICLLQMYLLEDLEKNILPYRRERFWEKFLVYCIAALAMFGTNRLESSILNMVMIPVIYMIASMVVFRGNICPVGRCRQPEVLIPISERLCARKRKGMQKKQENLSMSF